VVAARFSCFGVLSISLRMVKPIKRMRRRAEKGILCLQQMMLLIAATILQASLVMHAMSQGMLLVARAVAVVKIARQDEQDEQEEEEEEHGVKGVEEAEASHVDVARTEIIHQIVDPGAAAAAAAGVGRGRSPARRGPGKGGGKKGGDADPNEEVTTLFLSGLPDDAREEEVRADLESCGEIIKVVVMKRGSDRNAFVRFQNVRDAHRCMDDLADGKIEVCGQRGGVKAEMARRNTN